MSTENQASTPADELQPLVEQAAIKPIEEDGAPEAVVEEPAAAPAAEKKETDKPVDPRAARMEEIAERNRERVREENEQVAETLTPADRAAAPAPAAEPERMIKLKIRGETVEMPESEVIARAQKNEAADQYMAEARSVLEEAKRTVRQPQPAPIAEPAPAEPKPDPISKAIEMIQVGGDPAEVRAILRAEIAEEAAAAAQQAIDSRESGSRAARYDADYNSGFAAIETEFEALKGPVAVNTVRSLTGALQAHVISEFLGSTDEPVRAAFAQAGISAETLPNYSPDDANALYKDMLLKGYRLPRPSDVVKAAAKTVAEKFSGTTQPAPEPAPAPQPVLDRAARKDALVQPERTAVPRPTTAKPAPRSEAQRAASARQELRGARRTGAARG